MNCICFFRLGMVQARDRSATLRQETAAEDEWTVGGEDDSELYESLARARRVAAERENSMANVVKRAAERNTIEASQAVVRDTHTMITHTR